MYALRSDYGLDHDVADETLPRDQLNHIYKFGWCTPDATAKVFLQKVINMTFPTRASSQVTYIYLLARKHTVNYSLQCIVMKAYVPLKFLFHRSRLPLYYCHGEVYILMLNTINKFQIHEFFLNTKLNLPINFSFEFYYPKYL